MIGTIAGSYRIVSKISEGGMGVVYRAEHTMIGRPVAVKVLLPELSNQRDIVTRFFNEARAATAVRHPGIVEIFDFGYMPSGQAYLVMELLAGESVAGRLRRIGKMPEADAAALIRATASALAAAHAHGIVHRDLKPDNLFICPDPEIPGGERPKLLDFGIAKLSNRSAHGPSLTRTGAVLGTPTYMSPEQCRGAGNVDLRADLYSLGCILYELVTGRPPFTSQSPGVLIANHLLETPVSPRSLEPSLTVTCDAIILRLLAKKADDRYPSADALAAALEPLVKPAAPAAWLPASIPGAFDQGETQVSAPPTWATPPPMPAVPAMPSLHPGPVPTPPPPVGPATPRGATATDADAPDRNRRGLAIVLGALVGVAAIIGVILVMSPGGAAKAPPADAGTATPAVVIDAAAAAAPTIDAAAAIAVDAAAPVDPIDAAPADIDAAAAPVSIDAGAAPKPKPNPPKPPRPNPPKPPKPPKPPIEIDI